ncbi:MAG: hypothetical protein IKQ49_10790 [Eubacterium sp.]|nr:hypothetical protein [Eubacterium sp.]
MTDKEIISNFIREGETGEQRLGLELEHFILNEVQEGISFEVLSELIRRTGEKLGAKLTLTDGRVVGYETVDHSVSVEPACQFEISIAPFSTLARIEEVYREFRATWDPEFSRLGYIMVTKGLNPGVESGRIHPTELPLIPKNRYYFMDRYFRNKGRYGAHMMRASASTQVSLDYSSEEDMVRKLRLLTILSPVLMQLMENKSYPDSRLTEQGGKHLLRTQIWDDLDSDRTGFFPGAFEGQFGYEAYADLLLSRPLVVLTDGGNTTYAGGKTLPELLHLSDAADDPKRQKALVEHLMSMFFHHIRLKRYLEVRVADSVSIRKALGYAALLKGLLYSERNLVHLEKLLSGHLIAVEEAIFRTEIQGENAIIYSGKRVYAWARDLIRLAEEALPEEERIFLKELPIVGSKKVRTAG